MVSNDAIMASNETITSRNEGDMVKLTDYDIPGAKLTGKMDGCTMHMPGLKWRLLCPVVRWLLAVVLLSIHHHEL